MPSVELSWAEIAHAGHGGLLRQIAAWQDARNDPDAHHRDPMGAHVAGAIAEFAFARWAGKGWDPQIGLAYAAASDGDVGRYEVKSTHYANGALMLQAHACPDRAYVLVIAAPPRFRLVGWLWGRDGMLPEFWRQDMPKPCYVIPQPQLRPMPVRASGADACLPRD